MKRDQGGVARITAPSFEAAFAELGVVHATDRPAQLALTRIIATGRATECLADDPELLEIDRYFRWLGLYRGAEQQAAALRPRERAVIEAYCAGVNHTMKRRRRPLPFRIWRYDWEPWRPADVVTITRLMAWVGLACAQATVEQTLVELVQAGVAAEKLRDLLGDDLGGCDFALLRQITLAQRITPAALVAGKVGSLAASNNWVVAPDRSATGSALLANDMHLEVNRLPAIWYEIIIDLPDDTLIGTTVPGLPGVVTGRNRHLAWGATYTEADTSDFFVEDCREGQYLKDGSWHPFEQITETIRRRNHEPETLTVFRNDRGLLLGDATQEGKYLCLAWSAWQGPMADVVEAMHSLAQARSVEEGMRAAQSIHYPSLNWVFADRAGSIGYQMAGLMPRRREGMSGLYPVAGWTSENDWRGFVPADELPTAYNPPEGVLATANQDLSALGQTRVQTAALNSHRADRILELLARKQRLSVEDMKAIQLDVHSRKAARLAPTFADALPDGPARRLLLGWDGSFDVDSRAATLFRSLYRRALSALFCQGTGAIPQPMFDHLLEQTGLGLVLDRPFEQTLLREASVWYEGRSRQELLEAAFRDVDQETWEPWGDVNRMTMENIYFGGKLPRFLGFDRGPIAVAGSEDTPRQGTLLRDAGRDSSFCPSNRFVTDLGSDEAHTVIPGGPSESRFSRYYVTDLEAWRRGEYKTLRLRQSS